MNLFPQLGQLSASLGPAARTPQAAACLHAAGFQQVLGILLRPSLAVLDPVKPSP